MSTSPSKLHFPSYAFGAMTGAAVALCGSLLLGFYIYQSVEQQRIEHQTLAQLRAVEHNEPGRQLTLDTLANTYAHLRIRVYHDPKLLGRIEESARKHADLARELEKRKEFWEKRN